MFTRQVYKNIMINRVIIVDKARKQLNRSPRHIVAKLMSWVDSVENEGLEFVRRIPGFHDEPLKGKLRGERSIRLTRSYRAVYRIVRNKIEFVSIEEVSKHDY